MAYPDTKARIVVHAQAAAAAVTPAIDDVQAGFAAPSGVCVRIYWGGEGATVRMGAQRTLNSELIGNVTVVELFLPISALEPELAALVDSQAQAFIHELRTRVLGDSQLDGNQTDLEMDYAVPEIVTIGNVRYGSVVSVIHSDYTEYPITP